jgi:hypothetical protein
MQEMDIKKMDIGPIFFEDTISFECYCELILYPFIGHLRTDDISFGCFQQDCARAHTANVSMAILHCVFGE